MAKKYLPQIYFDEHIKPGVIETFKDEGFRCLLISNTRKYKGRDEKDYIEEIYSEGRVFVTSDLEFADYVLEHKMKHAGILLIPSGWDNDTVEFATAGLIGIIKAEVEQGGKNALRRLIFYIADDGYRVVDEKGKNKLLYSIEAFQRDLDTEYPN